MSESAPEKNSSPKPLWPMAIGVAIAVTFVAAILPARFKLFGLWNVLFGLSIAFGVRQASEISTSTNVDEETPQKQTDSDQPSDSAWTSTTLVVVLALLGQLTLSGFSYFQFRSAVDRAWKSDPSALFAAKVMEGKINAKDQANAEHIDQMKELISESAANREEVLRTRKSWMTWALKRVDKTLGVKSSGLAIAIWLAEVLLGCLAALFGFVRWFKPKPMAVSGSA